MEFQLIYLKKCRRLASMLLYFKQLHVLMATIFTILLMLPTSVGQTLTSSCSLRGKSAGGYLKEGDYIFGAALQIFLRHQNTYENFKQEPATNLCYIPSLRFYRHHLAVIFATKEINQNPNLLPNVTLGYHIYESCFSERRVLASTLSILTGTRSFIPNYSCHQKGTLIGFVGHMLSSLNYVMSEITGVYKFPQISHGSSDPSFSDRTKFPMFYRTTTSEKVLYDAIIQLLNKFGWSWVGILTTTDESSQKAGNALSKAITENGGCVEFLTVFTEINGFNFFAPVEKIKKSTANVIIVYGNPISIIHIFLHLSTTLKSKKTWILASAVDMFIYNDNRQVDQAFNGSLHFLVHEGNIPGLKEFLYSANPVTLPDDDITATLWYIIFDCIRPRDLPYDPLYQLCSVNDTLSVFDNSIYNVDSFRHTYSIYIAVYAFAHALHDMLHGIHNGNINNKQEPCKAFTPWKLNQYLRKVVFQTTSKEQVFFEDYGEIIGRLDILNWNVFPNATGRMRNVGEFDSSNPSTQKMNLNREILWGTESREDIQSLCVPACEPGYRKAVIKGSFMCCYDCVRCSEGHFSNHSDMENCIQCPEDQWPTEERNKCIMKSVDFLSYEEPLGLTVTIAAVVLSIITAIILGIFIQYKDSPIVKANNQELSYTLLVSLMLSPLCILLFIGPPTKMTCLLRHIAFDTIFAISISSVLGKTITVVIAFNAIKPGSKLKSWIGVKIPRYIVLLCSSGEVLICCVWILYSPPFPDYDTRSQSSVMILKCNEGFTPGFYIQFGYNALLASICFLTAYFARKLPDMFNEAQHITFSMLVFCSVWISFIPSYLSTNGKYMVAVEIFAILASSSVLLGCIFISKCYIIFLRPDLNIRRQTFLK